jgi:uracil-DNA glycosylase family 4
MDKKLELTTLREEVSSCIKCPELVKSRKQTVFGEGNIDANLMIIGESPGFHENEKGIPFVGDAGDLLNNIIKACGWKREDIFICNILKCRPEGNRNPTDEEVYNCKGYLDKQIEIVKPKYLLLLGSIASKALLGGAVSSLRGVWFEYRGIPTICTFHPSHALRGGDTIKREIGRDLKILLMRMRSN